MELHIHCPKCDKVLRNGKDVIYCISLGQSILLYCENCNKNIGVNFENATPLEV